LHQLNSEPWTRSKTPCAARTGDSRACWHGSSCRSHAAAWWSSSASPGSSRSWSCRPLPWPRRSWSWRASSGARPRRDAPRPEAASLSRPPRQPGTARRSGTRVVRSAQQKRVPREHQV